MVTISPSAVGTTIGSLWKVLAGTPSAAASAIGSIFGGKANTARSLLGSMVGEYKSPSAVQQSINGLLALNLPGAEDDAIMALGPLAAAATADPTKLPAYMEAITAIEAQL